MTETPVKADIQRKTQLQPKTQAQTMTVLVAFDPGLLKKLEAELAQHLGPIAAVVVRNAAKKAPTQADLVRILSEEISDAEARGRFEKKFSDISRPNSQLASGWGRSRLTEPATALSARRFPIEALA